MIPIKVKDENGKEVELDAELILAVCANKSNDSQVKSLIITNDTGYLFSCEDKETILKKISKVKPPYNKEIPNGMVIQFARYGEEDCIGLTD